MDHERQPIIPSSSDPQAGIGRIVRFPGGRPASDVIGDMLVYLLQPQSVNIAIPQDRNDMQGMTVRSIGICAGSGGSVFKDLDDVEMLITGEMSHHEALAATENGKVVLCLGHSNSERQYLQDVMKPRLKEELGEGLAEADVEVSVQDRDPFLALVRDADRN